MNRAFLLSLFLGTLLLGIASCYPHRYADEDPIRYRKKLRAWLKRKDELEQKEKDKQTSSEEDDNAVPKPGEMFEGDIIMDERLRNAVLGKTDKRSSIRGEGKRWPNGVVPYEFAKDVPPDVKEHIREVLKFFQKYTCIRIIPRTNEKSYVIVRYHPNMCASYVGRQHKDKPQYITLGHGCQRDGTIEHEFMHALGFIHEQSRYDRDEYVKILWHHIGTKEFHNFRKYSVESTSNDGKQYDFSSVMHYGPYAFSEDGEKTIVPKNGERVKYGQRRAFSEGDVAELNTLYNCPQRDQDTSGLVHSTNGKREFYQHEEESEDLARQEDDVESFSPEYR